VYYGGEYDSPLERDGSKVSLLQGTGFEDLSERSMVEGCEGLLLGNYSG